MSGYLLIPCKLALLASALLVALQASAAAAPLLPSQDDPNVFSVKICQDREVVSAIKSAADRLLKTSAVLANGMREDDMHLDAVFTEERLVYCSMTIKARGIADNVRYIIGHRDASYVIILGGNAGSRLFPKEVTITPVAPRSEDPVGSHPQH